MWIPGRGPRGGQRFFSQAVLVPPLPGKALALRAMALAASVAMAKEHPLPLTTAVKPRHPWQLFRPCGVTLL